MSKESKKRALQKRKRTRNLRIAIIVASAACLLVAGFFIVRLFINPASEQAQISALKDHIFNQYDDIAARIDSPSFSSRFVVFLSVCNAKERAFVVKGAGETLRTAWRNAEKEADGLIKELDLDVVWAKADIACDRNKVKKSKLYGDISKTRYANYFRAGIAFDEDFGVAFLEAELNGNRMIDYDAAPDAEADDAVECLRLNRINRYLETHLGQNALSALPDNYVTFSTIGFFCGEDGTVYDLYTEGLDYGRRVIGLVDDNAAREVIVKASEFLYGMLQPDGEYVYGYFPASGNEIDSYNILRHTGSTWALINLYRISGDDGFIPGVDAAIGYLADDAIEYTAPDTAYVIERKDDEVKLGGNGLAVIMLTEYMDVFGTDKYVELVRALANGILALQEEDGSYYHVLEYADFSPKEQYRTVYYDGEATFALSRAYTFTGDQKYLDGAQIAVEYFIENDYEKYRDHWVAYSLNELTKYIPNPRYFEFALLNVGSNLDYMFGRPTLHPTYLELLMAGWQTYERMVESNIQVDYDIDMQFFAETIYQRVFHMLNGVFYPEFAMYMAAPDKTVDAFFVRDDNFRIRIDDIQHYIGGNYFYLKYYNDVREYLTDEFLAEIHG